MKKLRRVYSFLWGVRDYNNDIQENLCLFCRRLSLVFPISSKICGADLANAQGAGRRKDNLFCWQILSYQ